MSALQSIPVHKLPGYDKAPRVRRHVGNGMYQLIIDPKWLNEAQRAAQRRAVHDERVERKRQRDHASYLARKAERERLKRESDEERRERERLAAEEAERQRQALFEEWLRQRAATAAPKRVTVACILRKFNGVHGVSTADVKGSRGDRRTILIRQAIAYWARRRTGRSLPEIGRILGSRDHTTILHACRAYPKKRAAAGRHIREIS